MSTVKNILAIVNDTSGARAALEAALRMAKNLECHVDALHVRPDPVAALPLVGEAMSGTVVDEMMGMAEREASVRSKDARAMYDKVIAGAGMMDDGVTSGSGGCGVSWLEETGIEEQVVALRACRADMIVIARPTPDSETSGLMTLNAALMQSGRPVMVPPSSPPGIAGSVGPFKRIAVFWNGSTEATRAVAAARPFFAAADQVVVLRVEEEEWFAPTEDLEVYLARHDVKAVVCKVLPRDSRPGRALMTATTEIDADLMVMGAYTQSKLRQLILGSVTGYVMHEAMLPVFMCH
jgi:nucleotide-binding universal stress UspA family protein